MEDVNETKRALRAAIIKKRGSIPSEIKNGKDILIKEKLSGIKEYGDAHTVMLFASFGTEVDTTPIITDALGKGKKVILPKVDVERKELRLFTIKDMDDLTPGFMGIPEPEVGDGREIVPTEIEFILMPGTAFDERGGRLGYGGGYYDRLLLADLKDRPPLVAIAYDEQITDNVPVTGHDVRVDMIVTDKRIITVHPVKA